MHFFNRAVFPLCFQCFHLFPYVCFCVSSSSLETHNVAPCCRVAWWLYQRRRKRAEAEDERPETERAEAARRRGLILVGAVAAALATWSIDDPSLSHATARPAQNVLGTAGASVADLLMQMFGLASTLVPLSLAIAGWRLLFDRRLDALRKRALLWVVGLVAASAAVACGTPKPRKAPAGGPLVCTASVNAR